MTLDTLLEQLAEANAVLMTPRHIFDATLIGLAERAGEMRVAAYDKTKYIQALADANEWAYDDAVQWFVENTADANMGTGTPVFVEVVETA